LEPLLWDNMKYTHTETKCKEKYSNLWGMKLEGAAESTLRTSEEFMTLTQQNVQTSSLDILITVSHQKFLHVLVWNGATLENQTKVI